MCVRVGRACLTCLEASCSVAKYPYLKPRGFEDVLLGLPVGVWGGRSIEEGALGAGEGDRDFSGM